MMNTENLLKQETEYYEAHKAALMKDHLNKFVLIHRDELVGAYESEEQAIREGAVRCGQEPFLVRRTGDDMPVLTAPALNMEIAPCP